MTTLTGKTFQYDYGAAVYKIHFTSEDALHWHCLEGDEQGREDDETYHVHALNADTFFISWIEKDGTGVSQVLNLQEMTVHCFLKVDKECIPLAGKVQTLSP